MASSWCVSLCDILLSLSFLKFLATVVTLSLVDKAGRRRFLLAGSIVMTVSISLLCIVTLCYPGQYHQEICENTPQHQTHYKNVSLLPSYSYPFNTTTCTYMFNNQPSSHHMEKGMQLSRPPSFTNLPISNTQSLHNTLKNHHRTFRALKKTTSFLRQNPSPSTSFIHSNPPLVVPSTVNHEGGEGKLVCFAQATSTGVQTDTRTKNQSQAGNTAGKMPDVVKYVTIFSLMAFSGGYSAGYGPVGWLVLSEIFPTAIKGRAFAATTVLNWSSNLVVSLTMLDLIDSVGVSWTFFLYGIIGVLAIIFIHKFVPETKNRSLEEINALFSTRNSVLQNCSCFPSKHTCCCNNYNFLSSTQQDRALMNEEEWEIESWK